MKNKTFIIICNIFILGIFLSNMIVPTVNDSKNYCREIEQAEKELNEINKKVENNPNNNYKLIFQPNYIVNNDKIDHFIIVSHSINYHVTSFLKCVLVKELPKRAPPVQL